MSVQWIRVDASHRDHPKFIRGGFWCGAVVRLLWEVAKKFGRWDGDISEWWDALVLARLMPLDAEFSDQLEAGMAKAVEVCLVDMVDGRYILHDYEEHQPLTNTQRSQRARSSVQRDATRCNAMQRDATRCNEMQRDATDATLSVPSRPVPSRPVPLAPVQVGQSAPPETRAEALTLEQVAPLRRAHEAGLGMPDGALEIEYDQVRVRLGRLLAEQSIPIEELTAACAWIFADADPARSKLREQLTHAGTWDAHWGGTKRAVQVHRLWIASRPKTAVRAQDTRSALSDDELLKLGAKPVKGRR